MHGRPTAACGCVQRWPLAISPDEALDKPPGVVRPAVLNSVTWEVESPAFGTTLSLLARRHRAKNRAALTGKKDLCPHRRTLQISAACVMAEGCARLLDFASHPPAPATARATAPPGLALLTRFIIYPSVCVRRQDIFWLAARREALKIGAKEKRQAGRLRRLLINNGEFCTMPVIQSETDIDAVTRGSDLTSLSAPESYLPSVKLSADVQLSI